MPASYDRIKEIIARYSRLGDIKALRQKLLPRQGSTSPRMKHAKTLSDRIIESNWEILKNHTALDGADQRKIADPDTLADIESYSHNIENCIGTLKLPIGVAGPLRINGFFANDDYYIPLATTEAALVASYNRGARLITEAGGCSVL
ncbi:MAG TPA: 3-hydroxy-3-methylglutaryl-CoA reductase, partial [Gammaproteobacteria bacterium]